MLTNHRQTHKIPTPFWRPPRWGPLSGFLILLFSPLIIWGQDDLPDLKLDELLEVVSIGTQMKTEDQLKENPRMKLLYREAGESILKSIARKEISPEIVFGNMQSALGHHSGEDFAMVLQDVWMLMELYSRFYELNRHLVSTGRVKPFVSFLQAIQRGLVDESVGRPLVASDRGSSNPLHFIREGDLLMKR